MKRQDVEDLSVEQLVELLVDKHGFTKANDLIARESMRIVNSNLPLDLVLLIKSEACKRMLAGQPERKSIDLKITKYD